MKLNKLELTMIIMLFVVLTYGAFADQAREDIAGKLVRLHVVANSDTQADQELKLKVRDRVLKVATPLTEDCSSKEQMLMVLTDNMQTLVNEAQKEIYSNGYDYEVSAQIKNEYFPTKMYDDFSLPAGKYDGIKIKIGSSQGQNWWCVVFPPLCADLAKGDLKELNNQEIALTTSDQPKYVIKFKIGRAHV